MTVCNSWSTKLTAPAEARSTCDIWRSCPTISTCRPTV